MSRSNNMDLKNPSTRWFSWSGSTGELRWYDKNTKQNNPVAIPFQFMVLDKLITISGYSDEDQSGIFSNEIQNTKRDVLTVRTKHGIKKQGLYEDVKAVTGAKFCQSVYIAFYDENKELTIGNLKLSGCAVSAWIEFAKGKELYKGAIGISDKAEGKKGATTYFSPVFEQKENVSPEANIKAMELDGVLQEYLKSYFAARGQNEAAEASHPAGDNESYIEQRNRELEDYGESKAEAAAGGGADGFGSEPHYVPGEPIADIDIPF